MDKDKGAEGTGSPLSRARHILSQLGRRPKKGLGQHFLIDSGVLRHIIKAAEPSLSDTVIEVGPGLGILTRELANHAGRVLAIEVDEALAASLRQELASFPHVQIIASDILNLDIAQFLLSQTGLPAESLAFQYKVVANLPYNIASAIIRRFLEADLKPKLMVVMVQKEVARSMVAKPGQMSVLSVSVQFYGKVRIVARVHPRSFYPPPKIHSAIIRIEPSQTMLIPLSEITGFFRLVKAGFSSPRKQIHNSLAQGLAISTEEAVIYLKEAGLDPQRRAQTLSVVEWVKLWTRFSRRGLELAQDTITQP